MTVDDFLSLCSDSSYLDIQIYDFNSDVDDVVWSGSGDEVPEEYLDLTLESFDAPNYYSNGAITINIDTSYM